FPTYVSGVHSGCDDPTVRRMLLENLVEEERGPANHPALWRRFAAALGASETDLSTRPRTPEVAGAIVEFRRATRGDSVAEGLAALYAYESQIPEISRTKREGLDAFYGNADDGAVECFKVHEGEDGCTRNDARAASG